MGSEFPGFSTVYENHQVKVVFPAPAPPPIPTMIERFVGADNEFAVTPY